MAARSEPKPDAATGGGACRRRGSWGWAALIGLVAGGVFLAVAELLALLFARQGGPILAIGSFVIDIVPRWAKEFAIAAFGANDKPFLLISLGIAVAGAAAAAGVLEYLRRGVGVALFAAAGVFAVVTVMTRAGAGPLAFVPTAVGTLVGAALLHLMVRRLHAWRDAERTAMDAAAVDRRGFLRFVVIAGASSLVVGVAASVVSATNSSVEAIRKALKLPEPRTQVTIPEGAELDIPGLTPLFVPNKDFYRVDTALTVPEVDPATWRLKIGGMVDKKVELSFDELLAMGLDEYAITLTCVSNEVGGSLLGNAMWWGVPVRELLKLAGPSAGADMVLSRSVDGFTASTPLESLTDPDLDAILAVAMNGEPLPPEHGFPVRMVVPGLYGYVSATKWLTELKVTTFAADQAYWTPRGYSEKAPIKLSSRVDTPRVGTATAPGTTQIAGVAWAQPIGIERVEVQIDDAPWQPAVLAAAINDTTWVQWHLEWEATAGSHYVAVRAVDKHGNRQIEQRAPIAPNGSTGLQRTLIRVG